MGFTLRRLSPISRWALTPPFQRRLLAAPGLVECRGRNDQSSERSGFFSVALSLKLPSLAVSQHPVLWSPDFPLLAWSFRKDRQTAITFGSSSRRWCCIDVDGLVDEKVWFLEFFVDGSIGHGVGFGIFFAADAFDLVFVEEDKKVFCLVE